MRRERWRIDEIERILIIESGIIKKNLEHHPINNADCVIEAFLGVFVYDVVRVKQMMMNKKTGRG